MPIFDVIVPAFNTARFLPMALDSVIAQTFEDWRILLVDDGSTDKTRDLVQPYQQRLGDKLKYIYQENRGLPAARNTAIRNSTAEFLALLDADDVWSPDRLRTTFERFQSSPGAALVYGFNDRIDPDGNLIDVWDRRNKNAEGKVGRFLYMRKLDLPCPTVSFRRSCLEDIGLFDETLRASEDRDLWIRIATRYDVALVPQVIAHYRVSPQAMSADLERMTRSQMRLIDKHYGAPGCGWRERRVALNWLHRQRAEILADRGQIPAALRNSLKALAFYPFDGRALKTTGSLLRRWVSSSGRHSSAA